MIAIFWRTVRTDIAQGTFLSPGVERVNHPDSNQESDGEIEQTNGDDDDPSPTSSSRHSKDSTSNLSLQRIPKSTKNRKVMLSNNVKN